MIEIGQGSFFVARIDRTETIDEGDDESRHDTTVTLGIIDGHCGHMNGPRDAELQVQLGPHGDPKLKAGQNVHIMVEV